MKLLITQSVAREIHDQRRVKFMRLLETLTFGGASSIASAICLIEGIEYPVTRKIAEIPQVLFEKEDVGNLLNF